MTKCVIEPVLQSDFNARAELVIASAASAGDDSTAEVTLRHMLSGIWLAREADRANGEDLRSTLDQRPDPDLRTLIPSEVESVFLAVIADQFDVG